MSLEDHIADYKKQAQICAAIDYSDKASVKANNKAVGNMYKIVEKLKSAFGSEGVKALAALLEVSQDGVNLWAAIHLLERTEPDRASKAKALAIIESASADNMGLQIWLKEFHSKAS